MTNKQGKTNRAKNKSEDLKGRAKEAAGATSDNDSLKSEGKADRAGAQAKDGVEKIAGGARDLVDKGIGRVRETLKRRRDHRS